MLAVFIGTCVVCWHILFGVIAPGLIFNRLFRQFHSKSRDVTAPITRIIGYGSILMVAELLALHIAISSFGLPPFPIVIAKFLIDLLLALWLIFSTQQDEFKTWFSRVWCSASMLDYALFTIALIYGICGTLFFPYGHDNAAIGWTAQFLVNSESSIASSHGSPAYIGVLVFPSLLLQGIVPVPTLAAGLKIPLVLLVAFVLRRFMNQLPLGIHRSAAALISMFLLFCVFFSHYGLLATGKETVFAITLFFLFMAELIHRRNKDSTGNNVQAALALAASIGFGAVSIPYALMLFFILIWLQWTSGNGKSFKPFKLTSTLILVTVLPVVVTVHAILDKPWCLVIILVAVPFFACYSRKNAVIPLLPVSSRIKNSIPAFTMLVILGLLFLLMPVSYFLGYFPMDGESTIIQVLDFNGTTGWLGFVGLLFFFFTRGSRTNFALSAFVMFPFIGLLLPLGLAQFPDTEIGIPKQYVWDIAKDIPNWILGFHSPICASFFVAVMAKYLSTRGQKKMDFLPPTSTIITKRILLTTIFFVALYSSTKITKRINIPTYNSTGGHHDPIFTRYIKLCYEQRFESNGSGNFDRVWISNEAAFSQHQATVGMYGISSSTGNFEQFEQTVLKNDEHQTRVAVFPKFEWNKFAKEQDQKTNHFEVILEDDKDVIVLKRID